MIGLGIVFGFSVLLVLLIIGVRYFEISKGLVFFPTARKNADSAVVDMTRYAKHQFAAVWSFIHTKVILRSTHFVVEYLLRVVRASEERLSGVIHMIRGSHSKRSDQEASNYIKTVQEHKRALIKKRRIQHH